MAIRKINKRIAKALDRAGDALLESSKKKNAFDEGVEAIQRRQDQQKQERSSSADGAAIYSDLYSDS